MRLQDLRDFRADFFGVCAPDKATLKPENHGLQRTTAGPYNAISSKLLEVGSVRGLGPDLVGIHSIRLAARYRVAASSSFLRRRLEKVSAARAGTIALLSLLYLPLRNTSFFFLPWLSTQRMHLTLFVGWTVMTRLMCRKTKKTESCNWPASGQAA